MKTICQLCYQVGRYQCSISEESEQAASEVIDRCIQYLTEPCPRRAILLDDACIEYVGALLRYGHDPYVEQPATRELYAAMAAVWSLHDGHDMAMVQTEPDMKRRDKPME